MIITALAGISYVAGAQAAQPPHRAAQRAAPVQRAVPVQRPAPVQRAAPVQRVAPRVFTSRSAPQVHTNRPVHLGPKITRPHKTNQNLHAVNPSLRRANPNAQKLSPNLAQPKVGLPSQGGNALKHGPGKPVVNPVLLKFGPGGHQPIRPAFPVVNVHNKLWPILKGPKFISFGGQRRFFVPVGLLGVALVGGSYWYPDGYV